MNFDEMHFIMECLVSSSANVQKNSMWVNYGETWREWSQNPTRARVLLLKGGPGQGKSTAGQYFGQIQRAAFLLESGRLDVPVQCLDFARELKKKAEEYEFWPKVPRIPLFIELKEYAKWYASKGQYDARNIVAYLCEKIKVKTAKVIPAETMHEAFQLSSWFANFDGLDEVPNDLKDEVANEIIEFTNELIPQLDADFLVLCTTRPQGYSGQFNSLNASEITLIPLPDEIALECASAVVEFNRDEDEAKASLAVLESAMASEQVKELMTTPLQAHIMAVVVRDGGRPPEKRWELFNNFYNVMKKRESLKNFPDPRIQTLLREQDQLLKSIHDRLGMCLHAKAEKAKGAEATLDRNEFKTLAQQTVELQFEENINSIVSTLMEATTERLVFVNTPDNSESVRFDIRQLQEFFAAEFVYTATSNEEFRSRIEVICGDAHWREVVHFLLSALVYHQKMSELSVAVNILQMLDDDSHNSKKRSYRKSLGTGALLTLRLLSEGVLEQDKKIRNPFAKSLAPIWGMIERDSFFSVFSVKKEQSKKWLTTILLDTMMEMDYSEHIVSGYLLSVILPDDHIRLNEVKDRILQAPEYYIRATLELSQGDNILNRGMNKKHNVNNWLIEIALNIIFSPSFDKKPSQRQAIAYLHSINEKVLNILDSLNITKEEKSLVKVILKSKDIDTPLNNDNNLEIYNPYCFVQVQAPTESWFVNFDENNIESCAYDAWKYSTPIKILINAVNFIHNSTYEKYKNFLKSIIDNDFDTSIIPPYIKFMLPVELSADGFKESILEHYSFNEIECQKILDSKNRGNPEKIINFVGMNFDSRPFDKDRWSLLCNHFPEIAVRLWSKLTIEKNEIEKAKSEHAEDFYLPIINTAKEKPNILSGNFFKWSELFIMLPDHEHELRKKLLLIDDHFMENLFHDEGKIGFFKINLPDEKGFIISFAYSIYHSSFSGGYPRNNNTVYVRDDYNVIFLNNYNITLENLINFVTDRSEKPLLRVASLACLLPLVSDEKLGLLEIFFNKDLDLILLDLISDETIELIAASTFVFLKSIKNHDDRIIEFLGQFSLLTKSRFRVRSLMQSIYRDWRERSSAPVIEGEFLSRWLSYQF